MAIITLTTDLGDKDIYQAALKGSIYKLLPTVNIVDITNSVAAFNVQQAALYLKTAFIISRKIPYTLSVLIPFIMTIPNTSLSATKSTTLWGLITVFFR